MAVAMALVAGLGCAGDRPDVRSGAQGGGPDDRVTPALAIDSNRPIATATDTAPAPGSTPIVHVVNTGTHGMAAVVRWLVSPDQRAIIVVEDPVGVEAESVPDGFLYASEVTGAVVQVDGVWDVTPSRDWSHLAFGRAFVFRSGEADSIPAREWTRFFGWLPEDVAAPSTARMRRIAEPYAFAVSGMSYAKAMGLAQVLDVASLPAGRAAVIRAPSVRLEGWRVRWTPSGDTLAVGAAPRTVQDDAEPTRWTFVRTRPVRTFRDSLGVAAPGRRFANVPWIVGPTIDISIPFDMNAPRRVPALGATVTSSRGRIRVERRGETVDIGPGAALAATRDGRFIAALRPNASAGEYDHKTEVVVYELAP